MTPKEAIASADVEFLHGVPVSPGSKGAVAIMAALDAAGYVIVPKPTLQRFEYKMVEVNDQYGLPGGGYSQHEREGWQVIKIFQSARPPGLNGHGFVIVYERPSDSRI